MTTDHSKTYRFRDRSICDVCQSEAFDLLADHPFSTGPVASFLTEYYENRVAPQCFGDAQYSVCRCKTCGFIWQKQVLSDDGLEHLYEYWIDAAQSCSKAQSLPMQYSLRITSQVLLANALLNPSGDRNLDALDFGMGWGNWCEIARVFGLNAAGAELSESRVNHGRSRGLDVVSLPLDTRRFDFINTEQVFEHITEPGPVLEMLVAHLKPGGILRIAVPNARRFEKQIEKGTWAPGKDPMHPLEHVNAFDHQSLSAFASNVGLRPVSSARFLKAVWMSGPKRGFFAPSALAALVAGQFIGVSMWFQFGHVTDL
ncbi:MAG: class I SAM-dependent methyltransferase [Pseudomonadota bacterium]